MERVGVARIDLLDCGEFTDFEALRDAGLIAGGEKRLLQRIGEMAWKIADRHMVGGRLALPRIDDSGDSGRTQRGGKTEAGAEERAHFTGPGSDIFQDADQNRPPVRRDADDRGTFGEAVAAAAVDGEVFVPENRIAQNHFRRDIAPGGGRIELEQPAELEVFLLELLGGGGFGGKAAVDRHQFFHLRRQFRAAVGQQAAVGDLVARKPGDRQIGIKEITEEPACPRTQRAVTGVGDQKRHSGCRRHKKTPIQTAAIECHGFWISVLPEVSSRVCAGRRRVPFPHR